MRAPDKPIDEQERLASLYRTGLLEGFADQRIKALTELATRMLKRPAAALSLVTSERQLMRDGVNLKMTSGSREESFCGHAILHPDQPLVVEDALLDPRFADNPLVTARRLPIRFYAGMPIRAGDGQPVGALCVLDHVPGSFSDSERLILRKLAEEIELIIRERQDESGDEPELLHDLQRALVADGLLLHWQPISQPVTLRAVGHEAFVRLPRPDGSVMMPGSFMALASKSGLISRIDRFVLQSACAETASHDDGRGVSVNCSSTWFALKRSALAAIVAQILAGTGLPPDRLTIELAEGVLMREPVRAAQEMQELKALGVLLALDNFGASYSALGYVEAFPFDVFKLDQTIVREVGANPRADAVAYAVIRLAHDLGRKVCAVGVETAQQLAFLKDEGCDLVQGNFIGQAAPQMSPA
nr:EAL domain-containing protein [uncultured Lichenicoccus sp.]